VLQHCNDGFVLLAPVVPLCVLRPVLTLLSLPHSLLYRPMLYDLFTSDIIFDKFEICCSPDGKKFASGSYRCALYLLCWCAMPRCVPLRL
jgi:hypothetical protein